MSPTAEAQMVKLPRALVARLDALRGDASRPEFLDALFSVHESDRNARPDGRVTSKTQNAAVANRTRTAAERAANTKTADDRKPSDCTHPATRRIGDACAACGTTGLKAKGAK
jgi:hypothetical protein